VLNRWNDKKSKGPDTGTEPKDSAEGVAAPEGRDAATDAADDDPGNADAPTAEAAVESETDLDEATRGPSLEDELAELRDRHLRLAAEFENFRKRTRKEAAIGRTTAQAELVQLILPTLDDLARVADLPHETTTVQALDEGIELILRNLRKQLADAGLRRIEAIDQPFDPELHQAIMTTTVACFRRATSSWIGWCGRRRSRSVATKSPRPGATPSSEWRRARRTTTRRSA
jgi:molecular chaperone GrpE